MTLPLNRRTLLTAGATAGASLALARTTEAYAGTAITWDVHATANPSSFVVQVFGAPVGSRLKVSVLAPTADGTLAWTSGRPMKNTTYFSPGAAAGDWVKAYARLYSSSGRLLSTSPTVTPLAQTPAVPAVAAALGMTRPSINTTFTSLASIDMARTGGPGFDWYTNYVWQPDRAQDPAQTLSIRTDADGSRHLHIAPQVSNCNWSISTVDQKTAVGKRFTHGYFEATVRYAPVEAPTSWDWGDWPSFWLASVLGMSGASAGPVGEIDILEALAGPSAISSALHQWPMDGGSRYSLGVSQPYNLGSGWHTFACAWTRPDATGRASVSIYVDDQRVWRKDYSPTIAPVVGSNETAFVKPGGGTLTQVQTLPTGTFACFDQDAMTLVLGTGATHPMDVKNVQVWTY